MDKNKELPPLMRKSTFLKIIQNILSFDDASMEKLSQEYADELKNIHKIFTEASSEYNRWNKKLCFELPHDLLNNYMVSDDSSLFLANYYKKNNLMLKKRINLRIKIQEDIYKVIPIIEKKKYGYLLKVDKNNEEENTPDIYLTRFFNYIENSFNRFYLNTERELYDDYNLSKLEYHQIIKLSEYSYFTIKNNLSIKLINSNYKDSLSAKILINSSLNRCILEIDELAHLQCDSYEFLFKILSNIERQEFNINNENDILYEIRNILITLKLLKTSDEINKKKLLKKIDKCLDELCKLHSNSIPESYEDRKKIHFTLEGKFLMGLTISLLTYKNYKIDLKSAGINHTKDYEIFNKNTKLGEKFHFPIQILINRIYHSLYYSEQYKKISVEEFSKYNLAIIEKRNFLRKLMIDMKRLNLHQFSQLLLSSD